MVWMKPVSANYKLMSLSELLTLLVHHISLFLMGSGLSIITCLYIFMLIIVCWCLFFMLWPLMYNYFYNVLISSTFPKLLSFDSVHINGPYRPGCPFFEDRSPTTVGYYAKDSSGNMATCNFNIYVNGNVWFRKGRWYQDVVEIIVHQWP
jgi:hypothetical protein